MVKRLLIPALLLCGTAASAANWDYSERKNDFSDSMDSQVRLQRVDGAGRNAATAIVVRCKEGEFDIMLDTNGFLSTDTIPVKYRFDDGKVNSEVWIPATDGTAAFAPSGFKDFRNGLLTGKKLVVKVEDFHGSEYDAKFELPSFKDDLKKVYTSCKKGVK